MRYKITCCKGCNQRRIGCNCPEYKKQKQELTETKDEVKREKHNFCDTVSVIWSSEQHYRSRFY